MARRLVGGVSHGLAALGAELGVSPPAGFAKRSGNSSESESPSSSSSSEALISFFFLVPPTSAMSGDEGGSGAGDEGRLEKKTESRGPVLNGDDGSCKLRGGRWIW